MLAGVLQGVTFGWLCKKGRPERKQAAGKPLGTARVLEKHGTVLRTIMRENNEDASMIECNPNGCTSFRSREMGPRPPTPESAEFHQGFSKWNLAPQNGKDFLVFFFTNQKGGFSTGSFGQSSVLYFLRFLGFLQHRAYLRDGICELTWPWVKIQIG